MRESSWRVTPAHSGGIFSSRLSLSRVVLISLASGLSSLLFRQVIFGGEPFYHVVPHTLLLIPYLCRLAPFLWRDPDHVLPSKTEHVPVTEILAADFSYEILREVSENFYYPVVVRGLFSNSTAVSRWSKEGYLADRLGDYMVSSNFCDAYVEEANKMERFEDAYHHVLRREDSEKCLFFPLFTRSENETNDVDAFKRDVVRLARDDLHLDRVRPGFASEYAHGNLHGCQIVAGRGGAAASSDYPHDFVGLGWHAEPGTNWFAQVVGRKRWDLMDPKDSALMMPFLETTTVFRTTDMARMNELHYRLPLRTVDLEAGDLLFNPDWWWHRTSAHPGLSVSVPMREVFPRRVFRNNPLFTMAIARFYLLSIGVN